MREALVAALGIAVSPFAVVPAVLLLFAPRRAAASAAFGAGWLTGITAVALAALLLADLLTLPDVAPRWVVWVRVALGAALVLLGAVRLLRRGASPTQPGWLTTLEQATPRAALRVGLVASVPNPKVSLLAVAGGFALGASISGGTLVEVAAVVAFGLVASSTALLPALALAVAGDRVLQPLGRVKDWLVARLDLVMSVILLVIGAVLLAKGIPAL